MIGERLYDLRKDAGLTQDALAEILRINKHSISSYERGRSEPPDALKIAMAKYFHVSVDYLLGLTNDPNPKDNSHKVLVLPLDLPAEAVQSLKDYAAFLGERYRAEKKA